MKRTKKTTLVLDEDLLDQVKANALARGTSATKVVAEALREYLVRSETPQKPPDLHTCCGRYIGPIDPMRTSELLEFLDEAEGLPMEKLR